MEKGNKKIPTNYQIGILPPVPKVTVGDAVSL